MTATQLDRLIAVYEYYEGFPPLEAREALAVELGLPLNVVTDWYTFVLLYIYLLN